MEQEWNRFAIFYPRDKIPRCKEYLFKKKHLGPCSVRKILQQFFLSLSEEYLGRFYREFPNADASSFAGRARNSCEFAEKDNTGEHIYIRSSH